ncbi:hypothetical protein FEM48_Zijuj08G0177300 [Ziziphus jujuba var. spinosa]|uniref:Receptor-like protein EIX2 n=1 Tax=Ziziphus jujuba var. spinosa TaxID=714518 RepID=A0A978V0H3_ZIZJJ|nr:hypothetical protein FEM48_Zijuj08G0177300 [Ziziphus jujuba var. spinosa]
MPSAIGNLTSIRILELSSNELEGEIPKSLGNLCRLKELHLGHNKLNGSISEVFELWSKCTKNNSIESLTLFANKFSVYRKTVQLTIYVSSNQLNGSLPKSFGQLVKLEELDTSNNQLTGSIPESFGQLVKLEALGNNLEGVIPSSMGYLTNLLSLQLSRNNLSGELPLSLRECTAMCTLDISENNFFGAIPNWIGMSLLKLKILNLHSNKFGGDIPLEVCNLKGLHVLDLAHNNISGTIPKCFYNLSAMTTLANPDDDTSEYYFPTLGDSDDFLVGDNVKLVTKGREISYSSILNLVRIIDLSDNNIQGEITVELTRLLQLQTLNLSNNHLTGKIPSKMGDMKDLESLDLSRNQLYGEIPASISSLTVLSHLDLSYNNFTGRIPTSTQLQSFNESSFIGNQLCGAPLLQNCSVIETTLKGGKREWQGYLLEENSLFLSLGLGFAFGFWGLLGSLFFNTPWSIAFCGFLNRIVLKLYAVIFEKF